jgi:hypothetical protein
VGTFYGFALHGARQHGAHRGDWKQVAAGHRVSKSGTTVASEPREAECAASGFPAGECGPKFHRSVSQNRETWGA